MDTLYFYIIVIVIFRRVNLNMLRYNESKNCLKFSLSQKIITSYSPTQLFDVPLDPPLITLFESA